MIILNSINRKSFKLTMRNFGKLWCLLLSLPLSIFVFTQNCYAQTSTILSELFDRQVQPREAMALACGVLLVLISPKKYRTKLAGIVTAIIVIYFMIIVINVAIGLEGLDLQA